MRSRPTGMAMLLLVALWGTGGEVCGSVISFQEGVAPDAGYVADSTYVRKNQADTKQDDDPDDENLIGVFMNTDEMRGLFAFDLSDLAAAASSGQTIQVDSVSLTLTGRGGGFGSVSDMQLTLHQYDFAFVEADVTWNDPDGDGSAVSGDTTAGGTLATVLSVASGVNPNTTGPVVFANSVDFVSAVAAALGSGDKTLRLLARRTGGTTTGDGSNLVRTWDETAAVAANRPLLSIEYSVVPEPGTLGLLAVVAIALAGCGLRRRKQNE